MGLVSIAATTGWRALACLVMRRCMRICRFGIYRHPNGTLGSSRYSELIFYIIYHRIAHRVRLIRATYQDHDSSEYFNFAIVIAPEVEQQRRGLMRIWLLLLGLPLRWCSSAGR